MENACFFKRHGLLRNRVERAGASASQILSSAEKLALLEMACLQGDAKGVENAILIGADSTDSSPFMEMPMLNVAVMKGRVDVVMLLVDNHAPIDSYEAVKESDDENALLIYIQPIQ